MSGGSADAHRSPTTATELHRRSAPSDGRADAPGGLLGRMLSASEPREALGTLERFLAEDAVLPSLRFWLSQRGALGSVASKDDVARLLSRDIAQLDALLSGQVNAILHHPRFQQLEASWRGLEYLVEQADGAENVKIRVLNASWEELARDAERAIEFDQSQLFRKVYTDEFDTPGGEPFGLLIGDYEIRHQPSAEHRIDDVGTLSLVAQVAAAAFAPFVAGAHPAILGLDDFSRLEMPLNLPRSFEQLEYLKWRRFREQEDARFVGLTVPRVLRRLPYDDDGTRIDAFRFREDVAGPDRRKYLWGNAAYAFGAVVIRAYAQCGWLADIRGVQEGLEEGGLVTGLPVHSFNTDRQGIALKTSTDVALTDAQENELGDLGFMALCSCMDTEFSAFYGCPSVQKPRKYDDPAATRNARMSAMLQYMLCASRFAHYVKVMIRDKVGSATEASEVENTVYRWLQRYVTSDSEARPEVKAEYPLREARVEVRERPGKPGLYQAVVHLRPHFQLDELSSTLRLVTELNPGTTV